MYRFPFKIPAGTKFLARRPPETAWTRLLRDDHEAYESGKREYVVMETTEDEDFSFYVRSIDPVPKFPPADLRSRQESFEAVGSAISDFSQTVAPVVHTVVRERTSFGVSMGTRVSTMPCAQFTTYEMEIALGVPYPRNREERRMLVSIRRQRQKVVTKAHRAIGVPKDSQDLEWNAKFFEWLSRPQNRERHQERERSVAGRRRRAT
jgi:hypothetical protein